MAAKFKGRAKVIMMMHVIMMHVMHVVMMHAIVLCIALLALGYWHYIRQKHL